MMNFTYDFVQNLKSLFHRTEILISLEKTMVVCNNSFNIYFVELILIFSLLLMLTLTKGRNSRSKLALGNKSIEQLESPKDIVKEIHFASCFCSDNPELINRCMKLLEIFPEAVNYALADHDYTPFLRACWNGCAVLIAYMLDNGADKEATTDAGEGGVYLAAYYCVRNNSDDFTALQVLLLAGVDINAGRYRDGFTALHLAAARGRARLVKFLLSHGADPSCGSTAPIHLALRYGHRKTAAFLNYSGTSSAEKF